MIGMGGAYTLGVYIIHENILVRSFIWPFLSSLASSNTSFLVFSIVLFMAAVLIEYLRKRLFAIIKIDTLINRVSATLANKYSF